MKHLDVEEHQVIDRYLQGSLPPDEAALFEEHYLSCQQCLDQLAVAESMQRGFKRAAGQDAARLAATRQLAVVAWLSRMSRSRQAAALFMVVLVVGVVAIPGGLALRRLDEVDQELAETRRALEQEKERSSTGGSRSSEEIGKLRSELDASRRDLAQEQQARAQAAEQLAQARVPQKNVPILFLDAERGSSNEKPTNQLTQPPGDGWTVLSLQVDDRRATYQVILRNASGKELWRGTGLHPDGRDNLSLSLPGSLLAPGVYTLTADVTSGTAAPANRFRFLVEPP
jgi:anti-sigma factor RsiW